MRVEITNKETIKPSTPTPTRLKTYNISLLDQIAPSSFTSLVFIYPRDDNGRDDDNFLQTLKNSLSDTLSLFRPLAGKFKDNVSVDCNDDGVLCYETRVHSTLNHLLEHKDIDSLKRLLVAGDVVNVDTGPQLLVQINSFECSGIALGVSFSHKLCDIATMATFLKSWSARVVNSGRGKMYQLVYHFIFNRGPNLLVPTILPPRKNITVNPIVIPPTYDGITTRLVFDGTSIAALKTKAASQSTSKPTRVEVVTALIGKCAMTASKTSKQSYSMPYILCHNVNIRKTILPFLPQTTFGNVVGLYHIESRPEQDVSLDMLVDKLRKGRTEYHGILRKVMTGKKSVDEYVQEVEKEAAEKAAQEIFPFTSWCRFDFYQLDFGLGKPAWVGTEVPRNKNIIVFMDTKDGNGIEAYVTLNKQVTALFQDDPILLHYASVNPAA